jgi:hypothetical protein
MKYEFVCVWCGKKSSDPYSVCSAPDGDGHLFDRWEVKERKITAANKRKPTLKRSAVR